MSEHAWYVVAAIAVIAIMVVIDGYLDRRAKKLDENGYL